MRTKTAGTLAIIACAMIGVLAIAVFRAVPVEMAYPVEKARMTWVRKLNARWQGLWHGARAASENGRLRREVATLSIERMEVDRILNENARLREALSFSASLPGSWEVAEVLSFGGGAAGAAKTIRVAKGSLAGIQEGAVVVVPDGLVGVVMSVTPHTSDVLLVTDPSLQVACTVEGDVQLRGILSGGSEDLLVIRHLKAGAKIAPRSRVLTSGLGGLFPAGIQVGTFMTEGDGREAERPTAGGLEREGKVLPAVDFSLLEDVFIRK